jgi:hypothetical protein
METGNFRLRKRQNPRAYYEGFIAGLESSLRSLRTMRQVVADDPGFETDFGDGVLAGISAAMDSVAKPLASFRITKALFEATGMPPKEN